MIVVKFLWFYMVYKKIFDIWELWEFRFKDIYMLGFGFLFDWQCFFFGQMVCIVYFEVIDVYIMWLFVNLIIECVDEFLVIDS